MIRKETEKRIRQLTAENNEEYLERSERFKEMIYEKGYEHAKGVKFRILKSNGEPFLMGKHKSRMIVLTPTFCIAEDQNTKEVIEVFDLIKKDTLKKVKEGLEELQIGNFYNIYDRRKTA